MSKRFKAAAIDPENRAPLFVERGAEWFEPLYERHVSADMSPDKPPSRLGKSVDGTRSGIWVPVLWYEQIRAGHIIDQPVASARPVAREIAPPQASAPAPAAGAGPGYSAKVSASSEADMDFSLPR